ncbi:MAG: hypothetical protein KDG55_07745 [Rhodocyclaceae bacterium]|nr:hypothetical protein [Rhodocyclaceae bacterium]
MSSLAPAFVRVFAALAAVVALGACSGDIPEPMVWKAREVVVLPIDGGRQVEAVWVRKGVALLARYRTDNPVGFADLALDTDREVVWLRDGGTLKALTLPELELFAASPLAEPSGGPVTVASDGSVRLGEARYELADGGLQRAPVRAAEILPDRLPRG